MQTINVKSVPLKGGRVKMQALVRADAVSLEHVQEMSERWQADGPHDVVIRPEGGKHLWWVTWSAYDLQDGPVSPPQHAREAYA